MNKIEVSKVVLTPWPTDFLPTPLRITMPLINAFDWNIISALTRIFRFRWWTLSQRTANENASDGSPRIRPRMRLIFKTLTPFARSTMNRRKRSNILSKSNDFALFFFLSCFRFLFLFFSSRLLPFLSSFKRGEVFWIFDRRIWRNNYVI